MEIIFSFLGLIRSIISDFLYEKNSTNNSFAFNIKNKLISFKKKQASLYPINKTEDEIIEKQIEEEPIIIPYVRKKNNNKPKVTFNNQKNKKI